MKPAALSSDTLDVSAIAVSSVCLIHCLALPALSVILPLAGALGNAEWLHQLFVLAAVPLTATAIIRDRAVGRSLEFPLLASLALGILLLAAFAEPLHDVETILTTAGAVLLALAHTLRWQRRRAQA